MNLHLGIDPSLRSTGIVAINDDAEIVFQKLIIVPGSYKDEDNIVVMGEAIATFIASILEQHNILSFSYERLAFNAPSGVKDKIAGSYWYNRICMKELTHLYESFPWPPELVSPAQWRKKLINSEDRKEMKAAKLKVAALSVLKKEAKGDKDRVRELTEEITMHKNVNLKEKVLTKLPGYVKIQIMDFLEEYGLKKDHAYDLCDAYWIAVNAKDNYEINQKGK